jgi:hypothetical protein
MMKQLADDAEDIGLGDDENFLSVELHFGATIFGNENLVADLDGKLDGLAILILASGSEAQDLGFLRFFLRGIWKDDSAGTDGVGFEAFYKDALSQGFDVSHICGSFQLVLFSR